LVSHYSFYAVFQTPEEYRLISDGRELGTLPVDNMVAPGMMLIFSGRRWLVQEVDDRAKVILVTPAKAGTPPIFGGDAGIIHDVVIERMFSVLKRNDCPPIWTLRPGTYWRKRAQTSPRCTSLGKDRTNRRRRVDRRYWRGTVNHAFALRARGFTVQIYDGFLEVLVAKSTQPLEAALKDLADGGDAKLFADNANLMTEKFHPYLSKALLEIDALAVRLDENCLPALRFLIANWFKGSEVCRWGT
jgi:ATP-dependent Lhr-like helicase